MKLEWKTCFKVGISIFILYLAIRYGANIADFISLGIGAATPLFIGCAIAYFVNILMKFYERLYFPRSKKSSVIKSRRIVCMAGAFLTLIALIVLIVSLVVPQLILCVKLIFSEIPDAMRFLADKADDLKYMPENVIRFLADTDWKTQFDKLINAFTSGLTNIMDMVMQTVMKVFSGIVTALISIIFSVYLLLAKDSLKVQAVKLLKRYLSPQTTKKVKYVWSVLHDCFHNYIVGQCLEAVILGGLCTLGMMILRLPYATMIGALVAFTALIPIAGAYIGALVGAFMILTVSPVKALVFLIFIVVLQQIEGNIIYPRVVGSSIGLPGIWVLAAITIGGGMAGILGMLIGVPIAAAVYKIIRDDVNGQCVLANPKL